MEKISKSEIDTLKIAKEFTKTLKCGDIVLLEGDLGAGKTVFVKGVVDAFGGDKDLVTSPTFTIVNDYIANNKTIFHFDLYRVKDVRELYNIGIEEYLYSDAISFVEWPERAYEIFDNDMNCKKVKISKIENTLRKIEY